MINLGAWLEDTRGQTARATMHDSTLAVSSPSPVSVLQTILYIIVHTAHEQRDQGRFGSLSDSSTLSVHYTVPTFLQSGPNVGTRSVGTRSSIF